MNQHTDQAPPDTSNFSRPAEIERTTSIRGRVVARNTTLNLLARVTSLLVAVATMPYVIRHLGPGRFGLLSLAWIVVGYFALLDLGLGAATTKFVAEFLGKGKTDAVPEVVWTAFVSLLFLGALAGIFLAAASPLLAYHVLKIPVAFQAQARLVFLILAFSLPIDLANGSLQGVLMATQRFDLVNAIGIPSSALTYLIPAAALAVGFGLPDIVLGLVIARVAALVVSFFLCVRLYPALIEAIRFNSRLARQLLGFGGWVTVSGGVGPLLVYFDRFLIGALMSIAAVGFYAPPYMISTKLWILPNSLTATLFPAFSAAAGIGDSDWIKKALVHSLKFLLLLVGPAALVLIFFAHPILSIWLGTKFAAEGTRALQILAAGVLINSLANAPYSFLLGIGRPDITAKFHLLELPLHIALVWFFVLRFGLAGAALAWAIRVSIDFLLLMIAACRISRLSPRVFAGGGIGRGFAVLAGLGIGLWLLWGVADTLRAHALLFSLLGAAFLLVAWRFVLNLDERSQVRGLLRARCQTNLS